MLCRAFVWFSCWASAHVCYMCRLGTGKGGALSWIACGAMCTWTAGLLDAVIGSAGVYLVSVYVVACATSTFVRVMVLTQLFYFMF